MNVLPALLVGLLAAGSAFGSQDPPQAGAHDDGPPTLSSFLGYWRVDPSIAEPGPNSPFRLQIQIEGDELTVERHGFSMTEKSRYRLDGTTMRTVQEGRPVDASVALEDAGLVFRTRSTLPDGRVANVTEVYSIRRRLTVLIAVERTTTVGKRTSKANDLLRRLPPPRLLHPDNQP